ncbi:MAG: di-heme oxidoredictase family protein [Myxococcota bacterium]
MRRSARCFVGIGWLLSWALACNDAPTVELPTLELITEDPSDAPIAGLSETLLQRFDDGDARFELPFRESQGLGPLYIHRSCASCHEDDSRGPGVVRRIVGDTPFGDVVRPRMSAGATTPIMPPEEAEIKVRLGPPVFGRGYFEAVSDETILEYERVQAERDDGISGRAHRVERASATELPGWMPVLGRFGHKARRATLTEFTAEALLGDMGMTTPVRPAELPNPDGQEDDERPGVDVDDEELGLIADYVRLLAIPRRSEVPGSRLFVSARCSVCHVPEVRTGGHDLSVLREVEVGLFTDFLLHDMGEGLEDGVPEGDATGREWRTAPLIGLRYQTHLLHDGRADTVRDAIAAHRSEGSEANDSVARFDALSESEQETLVAYVEAL